VPGRISTQFTNGGDESMNTVVDHVHISVVEVFVEVDDVITATLSVLCVLE